MRRRRDAAEIHAPRKLKRCSRTPQIKVQTARAVLPFLKDPEPPVRWNAAALLGQLGVEANLVVASLEGTRPLGRILWSQNPTADLSPLPHAVESP